MRGINIQNIRNKWHLCCLSFDLIRYLNHFNHISIFPLTEIEIDDGGGRGDTRDRTEQERNVIKLKMELKLNAHPILISALQCCYHELLIFFIGSTQVKFDIKMTTIPEFNWNCSFWVRHIWFFRFSLHSALISFFITALQTNYCCCCCEQANFARLFRS